MVFLNMVKVFDSSGPLMMAISKSIRERRVELGVSQEELGKKAQLHRTYISDIEAGRRNLSLRSLFRLATGLGLSVSSLLSMAESKVDANTDVSAAAAAIAQLTAEACS